MWAETAASGQALVGAPGEGTLGSLHRARSKTPTST